MNALANRMAEQLSDAVENIVLLDAIDSTHAFAIRLMEQLDDECVQLRPTVILARRQTAGVGRGERRWASPEGGLYLNWVAGGLDPTVIRALPMLAATAAHTAVGCLGVTGAGIKWPNDILVADRKLAGILVHARHGGQLWATVGLGINLANTPQLGQEAPRAATSASELLGPGSWEDRAVVIAATFSTALARSLDEPRPALAAWRANLVHRHGDQLAVRLAAGTVVGGTFAGLTEEGFLRLDTEEGERVVTGGDVVEGD